MPKSRIITQTATRTLALFKYGNSGALVLVEAVSGCPDGRVSVSRAELVEVCRQCGLEVKRGD